MQNPLILKLDRIFGLKAAGHRYSDKRTAHMLCELRQRLALVELADDYSFSLPLTQQDMADALGLSVVHLNRAMQHNGPRSRWPSRS